MADKKETALDAMAGNGGYGLGKVCDHLRFKFKRDGKRFWAGDNLSGINTMLHKGSNISKLTSV